MMFLWYFVQKKMFEERRGIFSVIRIPLLPDKHRMFYLLKQMWYGESCTFKWNRTMVHCTVTWQQCWRTTINMMNYYFKTLSKLYIARHLQNWYSNWNVGNSQVSHQYVLNLQRREFSSKSSTYTWFGTSRIPRQVFNLYSTWNVWNFSCWSSTLNVGNSQVSCTRLGTSGNPGESSTWTRLRNVMNSQVSHQLVLLLQRLEMSGKSSTWKSRFLRQVNFHFIFLHVVKHYSHHQCTFFYV